MKTKTIQYIVDAVEKANPQRTVANINRRLIKMLEELGEVSEAYLNSTSTNNLKGKTWNDVKEEAVDTLIVAIDIALTDIYDTNEALATGVDLVQRAKDGILHLTSHVGLDEKNYDVIIRNIVKNLGSFMSNYATAQTIAYTDGIYLVKDTFVLVVYVYSGIDESEIITEIDRKLAKWMASRNKVTEIDPEG